MKKVLQFVALVLLGYLFGKATKKLATPLLGEPSTLTQTSGDPFEMFESLVNKTDQSKQSSLIKSPQIQDLADLNKLTTENKRGIYLLIEYFKKIGLLGNKIIE